MSWYMFRPYVSVAQRRARALREVERRRKKGQVITPVEIEGRTIARTFWGNAWCDNLESYSDYENRLPRGRSYVCNGSVVDLQIAAGKVTALVSGSALYTVKVAITPCPAAKGQTIRKQCAGRIGSLVELLQGKLSRAVMDVVTRPGEGLFPRPGEIKMSCSCPDWAGMCKHIAAVLYGVGARLDHQPELLFVLRQVDHLELIAAADTAVTGATRARSGKKTLAAGELGEVFGIELAEEEAEPTPPRRRGKPAVVIAAAAPPAASKRKKAAAQKKAPTATGSQAGRAKKSPKWQPR